MKLPHNVIVKAPGLLPMLYKVSELAEDLGIPESTLREWLTNGAPSVRDRQGHLWINGSDFKEWVELERTKRKKAGRKLKSGEGFCMHCNKIILVANPIEVPIKGKLFHLRGTCPECGRKVNRGCRYG